MGGDTGGRKGAGVLVAAQAPNEVGCQPCNVTLKDGATADDTHRGGEGDRDMRNFKKDDRSKDLAGNNNSATVDQVTLIDCNFSGAVGWRLNRTEEGEKEKEKRKEKDGKAEEREYRKKDGKAEEREDRKKGGSKEEELMEQLQK